MKTILFACIGNAGRSQMAEAFAKKYGKGKILAISGGTMPASGVSQNAAAVMKEKGIDISKSKPKLLDSKTAAEADIIVTMGCSIQEACPVILLKGKKIIDWKLDDPKGKGIEEVKKIRDEIERKVKELISSL
jgi:protein-tyrosine-phosphatase